MELSQLHAIIRAGVREGLPAPQLDKEQWEALSRTERAAVLALQRRRKNAGGQSVNLMAQAESTEWIAPPPGPAN